MLCEVALHRFNAGDHVSSTPSVSIVIPLHNDEEWVANALESCIRQTLRSIEIVCVDDGSTDGTCAVIEAYQQRDSRIRLLKQDANRSAFQARRRGLEAAAAPYILFLDGDDELAPDAARIALARARSEAADVVGFGVDVVMPDGSTGGNFEASLQPRHRKLAGADIAPAIFPPGTTAQGHLWCNLYTRELLQDAYAGLPHDLMLFRANDIPITFLALAKAKKYVSTSKHLYRYFFRRGRSGHRVENLDTFKFYLGAVDSIECIEECVRQVGRNLDDSTALLASYESARLSIIGNVLRYCVREVTQEIQADCLALLSERAGEADVIRASANFCQDALVLLSRRGEVPEAPQNVKSVLIATNDMMTGGLQGVVAAQSRYLVKNGLSVTIAVHKLDGAVHDLPPGVRLVEIGGATRADKLSAWLEICRTYNVDVIIDHHILYNDNWPYYALIAQSIGVPTIGWLHNFALRTVYDFSTRGSFLRAHLPLLRTVVVLSTVDVSFWKLQGIHRVVWLPNPASPLLAKLGQQYSPKSPPNGTINLVWWGRLQQHTKQVRDLIAVAEHLRGLDVDFHLTIIGPDTPDLSAAQLLDDAVRRGVADAVSMPGPLVGRELLDALSDAHLLVSTSVIEGNPLTLVEAQAMGMPVVMYELPWVESIKENHGVSAVRQGAVSDLARVIARISRDPGLYAQLSQASLDSAHRVRSFDMSALYAQLLAEKLPPEFSPEPSLADASLLLDWMAIYSERNVSVQARVTKRLRARLTADLDATRKSFTFRVGRVVAFLPRQLAKAVRRRPEVPPVIYAQPAPHRTVSAPGAEDAVNATDSGATTRPSRGGLTGFNALSKHLLPTSVRQANILADRKRISVEQVHREVLGGHAELGSKLTRIETMLEATTTQSDNALVAVGAAVDGLVQQSEALAASEARIIAGLGEMDDTVSTTYDRTRATLRTAQEAVWSSVFHDTVEGSVWFTDRALSPGRWAVGYPFLYVMYRVLDEVRPSSILEIGLGQSTKVSAQYVMYRDGVDHVVVEHDVEWVASFSANYELPAGTHVQQLDLTTVEMGEDPSPVLRYADFKHALGSVKYDFILIDGPFGNRAIEYSRVDVLDLIPESLADRFIIMLDDYNRPGERRTAAEIARALDAAGIAYETATYTGEKVLWVVTSPDLKFYTSL